MLYQLLIYISFLPLSNTVISFNLSVFISLQLCCGEFHLTKSIMKLILLVPYRFMCDNIIILCTRRIRSGCIC